MLLMHIDLIGGIMGPLLVFFTPSSPPPLPRGTFEHRDHQEAPEGICFQHRESGPLGPLVTVRPGGTIACSGIPPKKRTQRREDRTAAGTAVQTNHNNAIKTFSMCRSGSYVLPVPARGEL